MTEPDDQEQTAGDRRPSPRPRAAARPAPGPRPSPRPRVAGSRRDRDEPALGATAVPVPAAPAPEPPTVPPSGPAALPAADPAGTGEPAGPPVARRPRRVREPRPAAAPPVGESPAEQPARRSGLRGRLAALVLAALCVVAAAGGGVLLWQREHPASVDPAVFAAARSGVEALYAYDYKDSKGSIARKLDVLTGDLRDQYRKDLDQGGIVDTYQQVSATTSYAVAEVGLQQVNGAQDQATLIVFGQYRVKSANSGTQQAPSGSECQVTKDGTQACTQTVRVTVTRVSGDWKISELTLLTTS